MSQNLFNSAKDILCAYISNHKVEQQDVMQIFQDIYNKLQAIEKASTQAKHDQTIYDEYLVCLEDGKKLKTLKRYLQKMFGLTPDQYRKKWNLPADYPMVAPNYSKKRTKIAKEKGLGKN